MGEDNLYGDTTEAEFAAEVWEELKNIEGVEGLEVVATYLEELPYTLFTFDKDGTRLIDREG